MTTSVRRPDPSDLDWSAETGLAAELRAVLTAATVADGAAPVDEAALLTLQHHGLGASTLLVVGSPVDGFAWLHGGSVRLVVHPARRRQGLGRALLLGAMEVTDHAQHTSLTAWSHTNHPGAAVLAAASGFERVRDLWLMRLAIEDPGHLPALPDPAGSGVVIRTFRPGYDEEAFLAVNAAAFASHAEQGQLTRSDLEQRKSETWFDPAGFFVAETAHDPGGDLIGFHWTKVHPGDPGRGEVYVVGVSPRAHGSGLGRMLTLTGLHYLAGLGLREVILYVEADNGPARAVYDRVGFTHADADTHVMYHRS
ncbi:mycothiol synthase [soil metagenome]